MKWLAILPNFFFDFKSALVHNGAQPGSVSVKKASHQSNFPFKIPTASSFGQKKDIFVKISEILLNSWREIFQISLMKRFEVC